MTIDELLSVRNISAKAEIADRDSVIKQLVKLIGVKAEDEASIYARIIKREQTRTTAFGKNVAIPHSVSPEVEFISMSIITLAQPISWGDKQVQIVCCIVAPNRLVAEYMRVIWAFGDMMSNDDCRHELLRCTAPQQIFDVVKRRIRKLTKNT
jgi:mannitol/fructose-specific phosphotransferase system IIA component (Ntr-type)